MSFSDWKMPLPAVRSDICESACCDRCLDEAGCVVRNRGIIGNGVMISKKGPSRRKLNLVRIKRAPKVRSDLVKGFVEISFARET